MYTFFTRNLRNYLQSYEGRNDYRANISAVFLGFLDRDLYSEWQTNNITRYKELNNLIYHISLMHEIPQFSTLSSDLYYLEYNAERDDSFCPEDVQEQMKIMLLCVRGQYI